MDVLGDILSTLQLRSTLYFRAELSAPFSISVPEDRKVIRFHIANRGPCLVTLPSGEVARFERGDLVLVPHGAAHVLSDVSRQAPRPLDEVLQESGFDGSGPLVFGGGGAQTVIVCGYFAFAHDAVHPVIASLPSLIHLPATAERSYLWLEQLVSYMEGESRGQSEAWSEIVRRVAEILFIHVLRAYMGTHPNSTAALLALGDPQIGKALALIHAEPARDWSISALAAQAAMSKTVFAERFRQMLGTTPGKYMLEWRMHKARALLDRGSLSVKHVAWEVGYESETAFNRVFHGHFGVTPGRFRMRAAGTAGEERESKASTADAKFSGKA
jgi:AraC family transcriptional regulator, activator of mtrCDE